MGLRKIISSHNLPFIYMLKQVIYTVITNSVLGKTVLCASAHMEKAMIKKKNKQNTTNKKACKMEVASLWGTIFL